jgi:hypothetical protein
MASLNRGQDVDKGVGQITFYFDLATGHFFLVNLLSPFFIILWLIERYGFSKALKWDFWRRVKYKF